MSKFRSFNPGTLVVHSFDATTTLSAVVSGLEKTPDFRLWFDVREPRLTAEPFLISLLPIAMSQRLDIAIEGATVSPTLIDNLSQVQAIWSSWFGWKPIRVSARLREESHPRAGDLGVCFTGGVDSFYTMLKSIQYGSQPVIAVFAHGYDIPLSATDRFQLAKTHIESAAVDLGVRSEFPASNIRLLSDKYLDWGLQMHGPALAALGHAMDAEIGILRVPASDTYAELVPWGSHPLLDPLWTTPTLEVQHDGCEASRLQKILRKIASSPVALRHLRVCWRANAEYNCGECEKCLRTMLGLLIAGSLQDAQTFPGRIDSGQLAGILAHAPHYDLNYAVENLEGLRSRGLRPDLQAVLEDYVTRSKRRKAISDRLKLIDNALTFGLLRRAKVRVQDSLQN